MSTENGKIVSQAGERLKEERRRLGLSQEAVCVFLDIKTPKTLRAWEAGISAPDLFDLEKLFRRGFDIMYLVSGQRTAPVVNDVARASYLTPAQKAAGEISGYQIDLDDAEFVLALARRLSAKK